MQKYYMSLERREIAQAQDHMENIESNTPEILRTDEVRVLIPHDPELAHYNAAVIQSKNDEILILLREVPLVNVKPGIPDKGNLLIYRSTPDKVEKITQLDLDHPDVSNWEDARAYTSKKTSTDKQGTESQEVSIGLTAIRSSDNKPVAAMIKGEVVDGVFSIKQESLNIYRNDEGKNVTPISRDLSLFRREGSRYSLEIVEQDVDENGENKLKVKKNVDFPKKSWCDWQIGTQAQFLSNGILPIHGVNRFILGHDPQTGQEIHGYSYNLGIAQLDKNLDVIKVSDVPLFTRESFKNILPMGKELDTNKDVIYCCGYSINDDIVKFVINIGDLMTVEVSKKMSELQELIDKSSPVALAMKDHVL